MYRLLSLMTILLFSSGCVKSTPLISHAHIGHAITGWVDTPGQKGLFETAESEAFQALKSISDAQKAETDIQTSKQHLLEVFTWLAPEQANNKQLSNYGVIRALEGAIDHIEYASLSEDASFNLLETTRTFSINAASVLARSQATLAQVQANYTESNKDRYLSNIQQISEDLTWIVNGRELNNDNLIGSIPEETGLLQLRNQLSAMASNEKPSYKPVPQRYLFGLVRLPNGKWKYNLKPATTSYSDDNY